MLTWAFRKVPGQTSHVLQASVALLQPAAPAVRRDIGPISLQFVIPMWTPSKLQVRYLQILKKAKDYNPYRQDRSAIAPICPHPDTSSAFQHERFCPFLQVGPVRDPGGQLRHPDRCMKKSRGSGNRIFLLGQKPHCAELPFCLQEDSLLLSWGCFSPALHTFGCNIHCRGIVGGRTVARSSMLHPEKEAPLRVLIVEDDTVVQRVLLSLLKKEGFEATATDSASKALDMLEHGLVTDLILSDVVMPQVC